ncbi:hypothetical protein INT45_012620 [Circinella minor]|uniref:Swiss Army Knife 2H phosphoesterase domain-containing protein n=1 Tax=Circinella minor TaxID=1195481 RepID=A0A8H7RUI0_9FUNG|nr:hypothetical protein INT45_012620 [Circinella minor]
MTHKKKKHHHNSDQQQHHQPNLDLPKLPDHDQPIADQLQQLLQQQPQQQTLQQQTPPDLILTHGYAYLSLEGTFIDSIAQHDTIPNHMVENRIKRDGSSKSHVTILHPKELNQALEAANIELPKKKYKSQALKKLIQWIIDHVGEPSNWSKQEDWPKDLGLAYVEKQQDDDDDKTVKSKAYFHVLHWPFGHKIRQMLHLEPAFFHVTVGFDPKDVHGLYKGPGTLVSLMDHRHNRFDYTQEEQTIIQLTYLLKLSPQYTKDEMFLNALVNQCTYYQNILDARSIKWRFIQQFITTSTQEVDETWFDASEVPIFSP